MLTERTRDEQRAPLCPCCGGIAFLMKLPEVNVLICLLAKGDWLDFATLERVTEVDVRAVRRIVLERPWLFEVVWQFDTGKRTMIRLSARGKQIATGQLEWRMGDVG